VGKKYRSGVNRGGPGPVKTGPLASQRDETGRGEGENPHSERKGAGRDGQIKVFSMGSWKKRIASTNLSSQRGRLEYSLQKGRFYA